jgi:hypothetical protein
MQACSVHTRFFDDNCSECKREYNEMKGISDLTNSTSENTQNKKRSVSSTIKYKEFTEERAKRLYEELLLQYLKASSSENEAAEKARSIIRKQCSIRGIPFWSWI